jgi:hypothetical protein
MNVNRTRLFVLSFALLIVLSACAGPDIYRPEVNIFQQATTEIDTYVKATQNSVGLIRADLRADILKRESFDFRLSQDCTEALLNLNRAIAGGAVPDLSAAANCKLLVPGREKLTSLLNPEESFTSSAEFVASVAKYASALFKITEAGNREEFVQAANGLGNAVINLAGNAVDAANSARTDRAAKDGETLSPDDLIKRPNPETFTPIANFVALATFHALEQKKTEALKAGAKEAHGWIEKGSEAVVYVMMSTQFEVAQSSQVKLEDQLIELQGAGENTVVDEVEKTIEYKNAYQRQIGVDLAEPFRKLPETHQKLLDAFNDRKRHLAAAIAVGQDLYQAARQAYDAIKKERDENKKE